VLVWDFIRGAWYTWQLPTVPVNVSITGDDFWYLDHNDKYWNLDLTRQDDANRSIPITIESGWIRPAGAKLQRFQELSLACENRGIAQDLQIQVYYDYNDTVAQTVDATIPANTAQYTVRFQPARQKCVAFKVRVATVGQPRSSSDFTLTEVRLAAAAKTQTVASEAAT
jgi:hypothetical protein